MKLPAHLYFRLKPSEDMTTIYIEPAQDTDVVEVVRCRDCVHRPGADPGVTYGFGVEAPRDEEGWRDETCPYLCADAWYNIMPHDDWFCHHGERKDNG